VLARFLDQGASKDVHASGSDPALYPPEAERAPPSSPKPRQKKGQGVALHDMQMAAIKAAKGEGEEELRLINPLENPDRRPLRDPGAVRMIVRDQDRPEAIRLIDKNRDGYRPFDLAMARAQRQPLPIAEERPVRFIDGTADPDRKKPSDLRMIDPHANPDKPEHNEDIRLIDPDADYRARSDAEMRFDDSLDGDKRDFLFRQQRVQDRQRMSDLAEREHLQRHVADAEVDRRHVNDDLARMRIQDRLASEQIADARQEDDDYYRNK
jgi:hypothetical protein